MFHKCGVIGISNKNKNQTIFKEIIHGLNKLQHRGKESCGISYQIDKNICKKSIKEFKNLGLVKDVFKNFKCSNVTKYCLGHVRYSTSGQKDISEKLIQPFVFPTFYCECSLVHNGNIPHFKKIGEGLNDTLMLCKLLKTYQGNILQVLQYFLERIKFAFCLLIMCDEGIYCVRDSYGYRPLCIGENKNGCCVVSESCALGDYKLVRDVRPGEVILLKNGRWETIFQMRSVKLQKCIFEHIYFMNKDTISNDFHTETLRYNLGSKLALEDDIKFSVEDTVVMAVPRTAIPMAKGYAETRDLEYIQILNKEAKSGRTFIMPSNAERLELCNKIFFLRGDICDKNIILVDDSLVRGNTIKSIAKLFKKAKSVHIRIASPPVVGRCFYGIDIPTEEELIASEGLEDLDKKLGVSSIKYLTLEGMLSCFGDGFCTGCFTKKYVDW